MKEINDVLKAEGKHGRKEGKTVQKGKKIKEKI